MDGARHFYGHGAVSADGIAAQLAMKGYAGSVTFSGNENRVAITSPRGGQAHLFDAETGAFVAAHAAPDICGVASAPEGVLATTGTGRRLPLGGEGPAARHPVAWDNHLVALA
ncbi:MAG: DUF1513 domain-containing protein [Paracoccaceae bacterium]|nr:DUF1513 domain-containing protein [Paracoccaceae bacterium]